MYITRYKIKQEVKRKMKIEKDIPMPVRNKTRELASKMEVNDSVLFKTRSQGCYLIVNLKKLGFHGRCRKVDDGFRVWRVK